MPFARLATRGFACACFGTLLGFGASAQTANPPVEAFAVVDDFSLPSLSPDGKQLAIIQEFKGKSVALIRTLDPAGVAPVAVPADDGFIVGVQWANNERLLVTLTTNQDPYNDKVAAFTRTLSVDTKGANGVLMFANRRGSRNVNYSVATVSAIALDDPNHVYMPMWNDSSGGLRQSQSMGDYLYSMFKVDVTTGEATQFLRGGTETSSWVLDGNGRVVARIDETKNPLQDHLKLYVDGSWKEVETVDAGGGRGIDIPGLTLDGKGLVDFEYDDKSGRAALIARDLTDGKPSVLFGDSTYDVDSAIVDPWTNRVVGARMIDDRLHDVFFQPDLRAVQATLQQKFTEQSVHLLTWDQAYNRLIASVEGPRMPRTYFLYDRTLDKVSRIKRTYEGVQPWDLGEMKPYAYKARDGLDIHGYVTLPPGKDPKNLPVVVMPHGGPMARDEIGFDFEAQFLANRGYVVFQPNFRGSSGYGVKFQEAGYGQWGLKMQDDVTDGVKKLIADGIADPKRICIVGGSYGGYAALEGAASTPDLFACAAGWAGVYDLRHFLVTRSQDYGKDSAMIDSWSRFIGDRWNDSAKLDAASPAQNAAAIRCPVLLMHGQDDTTVRVDQSEMMESALRHAGKKVTLIVIPKETHYQQASSSRVRWLTELEKFLKENIGN
jgi:dipeptidyl aminopeptidase/acylaminoacyl peptidase